MDSMSCSRRGLADSISCSRRDFSLLMERCMYFCAMVSFYSGEIVDPFKDLIIQIPLQVYLSEEECLQILRVLSSERSRKTCFRKLSDFSYSGLVFFASYFNSEFILEYILLSMWQNDKTIVEVLKRVLYFYGLRDCFTVKILNSLAQYLDISLDEVKYLANLRNNSPDHNISMIGLSRKLRNTSRCRKLLFSTYVVACAGCHSNIIFNYKGAKNTTFLVCCKRPIHIAHCYEEMISRSFDRVVHCPSCRTPWFEASPLIETLTRSRRLTQFLTFMRNYPHQMYGRYSSDKLMQDK